MDWPTVRRARALLGTFVEIRAEGLDPVRAARAIEDAFTEIAAIHRLMSFHEAGSDLDRLHRARVGDRVAVDMRTHEVLTWSVRIAAASGGRFDPTVAAQQVERGLLPRPVSAWSPCAQADWRDIELLDCRHVRLIRPLWIDLGGIAKGYAVDRAIEILVGAGAAQVCVNAGGDLRVAGSRAEVVYLRTPSGIAAAPTVELADGALATSGAAPGAPPARASTLAHVDGRTRKPADARRMVSVAAPSCVVADALTKVVLAGDACVTQRVMQEFAAQAVMQPVDIVYTAFGAAA